MKKGFKLGLAVLSLVLFGNTAMASTLTSTISMDNGYEVYISTSDTLQGTLFGSANNWYQAYTHSVTLNPGVDYYLHVFGYDQGGPAGFLGSFNLTGTDHVFANNSNQLLTNPTDWQGNNTGWSNPYQAVTAHAINNGAYIWSPVAGIPTNAQRIWVGDLYGNDAAYFSTKIVATVPVPAAVWMFGSALLGYLGVMRRRIS